MTPDATSLATTPPPPRPSGPAFAFTGRRGPLFRLLLKNLALTVLTLGIYRFWAKTAVRRYFWSYTTVLGDPLEYAGTGKEMLLGFLLAVVCLLPVGFAYGLLTLLVSPGPSVERAVIEAAYYLVLLFLIQVAVYRIWRYRLSRTLWRGIRFGLDGSSLGYAAISMGWLFLTVVTLGVAYPWRAVALWRYRLNHARFGTTPFQFDARPGKLVPLWLLCLLMPLGGLALAVTGKMLDQIAVSIGGVMTAAAATGLLFVLFRIREARLVIDGTRLGGVSFRSRLPAKPIMGAALLVIAVLVLAVGGIGVPATLGFVEAAQQAEINGLPPDLLDAAFFGFLGAFLTLTVVLPLLSTLVLQVAVVRSLTASTGIDQPELLEQTAQSTEQGPSYGEGLADAFDVGAI